MFDGAEKAKLALVECGCQKGSEFTTEHAAEHFPGEEEPLSTGNPTGPTGADTAGGNHAMHVRVSQKPLTPGMQDCEYANLGAQTAWVCGEGEQGLGDGAKQNAIDGLWILKRQHRQIMGQGEYDVAVGDRQQVLALRREPLLAGCGLALRAVPIATGVEYLGLMRAVVAAFDARAQRCGLACADVSEYSPLLGRKHRTPTLEKFLLVLTKDIGDFQPMRFHGCWLSSKAEIAFSVRVSRGLVIPRRCAVDTRRYRAVV